MPVVGKKRREHYEIKIIIKPPSALEQTELEMKGPSLDPEVGRTLWLLCAAFGGLIPAVDLTEQFNAIRWALERGIPAGHRAERGRIDDDPFIHAAQRLVAFARARHNLRALLLRLADGESGSGDGCPGRKLYAQAERAGLTVVEMPVLTELGRSVAGLLGAELSPEDREAAKWYKQGVP